MVIRLLIGSIIHVIPSWNERQKKSSLYRQICVKCLSFFQLHVNIKSLISVCQNIISLKSYTFQFLSVPPLSIQNMFQILINNNLHRKHLYAGGFVPPDLLNTKKDL